MSGDALRDVGRAVDADRVAREQRLRRDGKTSRADAERELNELRVAQALQANGAVQAPRLGKARIRVRASVRVLDNQWAEVALQIRIREAAGWLDVVAADHPIMLSRNYEMEKKTLSLVGYVELVMRRFLLIDSALSWSLGSWEARVGQGVTEYRAWLDVDAPSSVAVRTRADGMLNLYGLY